MSKPNKKATRAAVARAKTHRDQLDYLTGAIRQVRRLALDIDDVCFHRDEPGPEPIVPTKETINEIGALNDAIISVCNVAFQEPYAWKTHLPTYTHGEWTIPDYMMPGVKSYVEEGRPVGGFLRAVICNDLASAVGCADDINVENLPAFVAYFYNQAPAECHGSVENYLAWIKKHRDAAELRWKALEEASKSGSEPCPTTM